MPKVPEKPKKLLRFELSGPASPERVARAAQALAEFLQATAPVRDGEITLVIENFSTRGELRAWTKDSATAAKRAILFLEEPEKAAKRVPGGVAIARSIRKPLRELAKESAVVLRPRSKKTIRVVDDEFVNRVSKVGSASGLTASPILGEEIIVSPILRVGRKEVGSPIHARVVIGETHCEVSVPSQLAPKFYDAAKVGDSRTVSLRIRWQPDAEGKMIPDLGAAEAISISDNDEERLPWETILSRFHGAHPDAFENIEDAIRDLEQ